MGIQCLNCGKSINSRGTKNGTLPGVLVVVFKIAWLLKTECATHSSLDGILFFSQYRVQRGHVLVRQSL